MKTLKQLLQEQENVFYSEDCINDIIKGVKEWLTQKQQEANTKAEKPQPKADTINELLEELKT